MDQKFSHTNSSGAMASCSESKEGGEEWLRIRKREKTRNGTIGKRVDGSTLTAQKRPEKSIHKNHSANFGGRAWTTSTIANNKHDHHGHRLSHSHQSIQSDLCENGDKIPRATSSKRMLPIHTAHENGATNGSTVQMIAELPVNAIAAHVDDLKLHPPDKGEKRMHSANDDNDLSDDTRGRTRSSGMLAPNGKRAPIQIQFVSFGYKYSVPVDCKHVVMGTHANPFPPFACTDLPRAPHFVARLSGLSFRVKRVLLGRHYGTTTPQQKQHDHPTDTKINVHHDSSHDEENGDNHSNDELTGEFGSNDHTKSDHDNNKEGCDKLWNQRRITENPLQKRAMEIADKVFLSISKAFREGGHGYVSPLQMTIYIASDYGRHRSVVLCESAAQCLRTLLRHDTNTRCCCCSVATRHRDVDRNHVDEEAFGFDLRREHELEAKRKKRQVNNNKPQRRGGWSVTGSSRGNIHHCQP